MRIRNMVEMNRDTELQVSTKPTGDSTKIAYTFSHLWDGVIGDQNLLRDVLPVTNGNRNVQSTVS
jgi:hypothetical protein